MGLAPVENLKGFATTKPPLVVFMICLGLFAFILLTLSFYVQNNEHIQNPSASQDWNMFLKSFSDLEFCVLGNSTDVVTSAVSSNDKTSTAPKVNKRNAPGVSPSPSIDDTSPSISTEVPRYGNYSASMLLVMHPTKEFLTIPHNITHLTGAIFGNDLGIKGTGAEELINVTMEVSNDWNRTKCSHIHGGCEPIKILTCVYFQAPYYVFPESNPPECNALNESSPGVEYRAQIRAHNPSTYATFFCKSRPFIKVQHTLDPKLTVWLSLQDRSVINLHLLHTSYFLFVMVITLFCYATIRGRPLKSKNTQTSEVTEAMLSKA